MSSDQPNEVTNTDAEQEQNIEGLLDIHSSEGMIRLQRAASSGVVALRSLYREFRGNDERMSGFLLACVEAELFEFARKEVLRDIRAVHQPVLILRVLAQNSHAFTQETDLTIGQKFTRLGLMMSPLNVVKRDESPALRLLIDILEYTNEVDASSVLFMAAEVGNFPFIHEIKKKYQNPLNEVNNNNQSIFHVAVSHRHVKIYRLLYEDDMSSTKDHIISLEDGNGNNMLHLVGIFTETAKSNCNQYISGAAQQLQQELLWFKEVESMLPIPLRKKKNHNGFTPREEFTKNHKDLVTRGEKWMKETGAQLMVVAALLATISFAAAITFAGGYDEKTGHPIFRNNSLFLPFILFNFTAFICASLSIINIISLLTSRFAEDDFLKILPNRFMLSVGTVFFSLVTLTIAFCFNLFLLFENKSQVVPAIAIVLTVLAFCVFFDPLFNLFGYMFLTAIGRKTALSYD